MTKLSTIIMPLYNEFLETCNTKKITLDLDLSDPTLTVKDAKPLEKSIRSFINSAIKRTSKNGAISISAKQIGDHIKITIKDSGDALTRQEITQIENDSTAVHSRMGYGTTVTHKIEVK
jgi:signal transduction histidine kinase